MKSVHNKTRKNQVNTFISGGVTYFIRNNLVHKKQIEVFLYVEKVLFTFDETNTVTYIENYTSIRQYIFQ